VRKKVEKVSKKIVEEVYKDVMRMELVDERRVWLRREVDEWMVNVLVLFGEEKGLVKVFIWDDEEEKCWEVEY